MKDLVIAFEHVSKAYPLYHHITGGIKKLVFHPIKGVRSLRHSQFQVLKDISFEVKKGETLGIIGKNGAGKSTILGLIAGVLRPNKGNVIVKGKVSPLLELGAGFHPDLTGRENVVLNGVLLGLGRLEVLKKMDDIVGFSELNDFIDQPVRIYSSGMLARLGFSIVASLDPEVLLIDEILAVGDIDFQKKCLQRMAAFKKKGVTIILVSHNLANVESICDRLLWVEDHSGKRLGETKNVLNEYSSDDN
jgi:lipopolysaccharide transport system ATP-binding protein